MLVTRSLNVTCNQGQRIRRAGVRRRTWTGGSNRLAALRQNSPMLSVSPNDRTCARVPWRLPGLRAALNGGSRIRGGLVQVPAGLISLSLQ